uniref:Dynactin subunit 6 n=1 Tax=Bos indicus x Bos taurus TaxID=30522 RepID=A0A4W2HM33_BOBOX
MAEKTQKSVKIAPGAVVCVESEIRGDVTIGPRTVIHPKARIIAEAGPIVIGEGNLIEEQALIINAHPDNITPDAEDPEPKPMIIGTNNVFEVGCYCQAMKIGDNNVIESKAYVGRNVILTSGCIIGACCNLNTFEVIPENTVIYGGDCLRRVQTERPQPQREHPSPLHHCQSHRRELPAREGSCPRVKVWPILLESSLRVLVTHWAATLSGNLNSL